ISNPFDVKSFSRAFFSLFTVSERFLHICWYEKPSELESSSIPYLSHFFVLEKTSAQLNIVFVGMQPKFKHVPPAEDFSNAITFNPSFSAHLANSSPDGPNPIIATSYFIGKF